MNKYSTIKKIDDDTFQISEYDTRTYQFGIKFKYSSLLWIALIIVVCIVIAIICGLHKQDADNTEDTINISNESQENVKTIERNSPFFDDGFVLPNSSNIYLTTDDLNDLKSKAEKSDYTYSELLRYAVNEIYARHGYLFKTKELEEFYSQYQWYIELQKIIEVPWGKMNEYEQSNLILLLNEEKAVNDN